MPGQNLPHSSHKIPSLHRELEGLAFKFQLPNGQTLALGHFLVFNQSARKFVWIERKDRVGSLVRSRGSLNASGGILFAVNPFHPPEATGLNEWTGLFSGWPNMALECLSAQWQSFIEPKTLGDEMDRELVKCSILFHLCWKQSFGSTAALTALAIQLHSIHRLLCQPLQDK